MFPQTYANNKDSKREDIGPVGDGKVEGHSSIFLCRFPLFILNGIVGLEKKSPPSYLIVSPEATALTKIENISAGIPNASDVTLRRRHMMNVMSTTVR